LVSIEKTLRRHKKRIATGVRKCPDFQFKRNKPRPAINIPRLPSVRGIGDNHGGDRRATLCTTLVFQHQIQLAGFGMPAILLEILSGPFGNNAYSSLIETGPCFPSDRIDSESPFLKKSIFESPHSVIVDGALDEHASRDFALQQQSVGN
jgi:hypothetical protein